MKPKQLIAYPVSGQCVCMEGFLLHTETNGSFSCYEEFLQGPCGDGQQYILTDDSEEPICVPCPEGQQYIIRDDSDEPDCVPITVQLKTRLLGIDSFSGKRKKCMEGYGKDGRGNCVKKIINNRKNLIRPLRSATIARNGRRRNLRRICCE